MIRLQKENKAIKCQDITKQFQHKEEEKYYKVIRVGNFWSIN